MSLKDGLHFICVETSACWHLSYCDRTQDTELAQQCHCLAFHTAVCCNQKEKSRMWGWGFSWSQGLEYGNMAGLEAWTLGRDK